MNQAYARRLERQQVLSRRDLAVKVKFLTLHSLTLKRLFSVALATGGGKGLSNNLHVLSLGYIYVWTHEYTQGYDGLPW